MQKGGLKTERQTRHSLQQMTRLPLLFYENETRLSKRLHQDYTLLYIGSYEKKESITPGI